MKYVSVHGTAIDATPGLTILRYRDGFLQCAMGTYQTTGEARQHAADLNVIAQHSPMAYLNRYYVAT